MVSKIIQKEKERQEEYFYSIGFIDGKPGKEFVPGVFSNCHKQSLINLKEYMEQMPLCGFQFYSENGFVIYFSEDIKELTKIIERYE